ncbi:retinol dehydrogenase 7-like isoform 2-T2 [Pelodytes ibericus]
MWLLLLVILALLLLYRWHRQSQILQNLSDKYVFITGCDTGFGNILAKQLDRRGLQVLAACLTKNGAEGLKKETSSRLQTVILDITDSQSVSSATEWTNRIVGQSGLWGLVNNAGIAVPFAPHGWLKKDDYTNVLNVNLLGMIDVTLQLLPLVKRAQGRIVNVASVLGRVSLLGGAYSISKYGVEAFSDSLRREIGDFGVKVSIIEPGGFRTLISTVFEDIKRMWKTLPAEIKRSYGEQYYQKTWKNLEIVAQKGSVEFYRVTDCMEHALTACHPWTRYSAGWDAKLGLIPLSYLPTFITDYVISLFSPKPSERVK